MSKYIVDPGPLKDVRTFKTEEEARSVFDAAKKTESCARLYRTAKPRSLEEWDWTKTWADVDPIMGAAPIKVWEQVSKLKAVK